MASFKIFNASGHPIQQDGVEVIGEVSVPNVDLTSPASIGTVAEQIARAAAPHVRNGVTLALPGASVISSHVLTLIHGITGHWPRVAWAARVDGKFVWSEAYVSDLHEVRTSVREGERA